MNKFLINTHGILAISLTWSLFSVYLSVLLADWTWFSRSGAILTLSGAILAIRKLLRLGLEELYRDQHTINGGHVVPTPEELQAEEENRRDIKASRLGFCLLLIGTLIWGYGDLINYCYSK
jgi:hypothetical protein